MKLTVGQIEFMIEELSSEIIQMLMEEWGCDMTQAMDIYYNSDTFDRLVILLPACTIRVQGMYTTSLKKR